MRKYLFLSFMLFAYSSFMFASEAVVTEEKVVEAELTEEEAYYLNVEKLWAEMKPQTGKIELVGGVASLNVPDNFYYLNPKDTATVLTDFWGNPPSEPMLGMLFRTGSKPFDSDSWGVTIEYSEEGYVSDEDAGDVDYSDLLTSMQEETEQDSLQRIEAGYEGIELIGWAAEPFYESATHKLHWAKEIRFGEQEINTLNYNIRVLGRKGVLVLNFIAGMDQLDIINSELSSVLAMADFNDGSTYGDFDPDMDTVAAYGLGALVAGKVIAKSGFLVALLLILKKFGVFILIGIGVLFSKFFKKKKDS